MSRFTRWRERQRAKEFRENFRLLGEVQEYEMQLGTGEIRKRNVAECSGMRMYMAPLTSQRIIKKALGGLVKPDKNK